MIVTPLAATVLTPDLPDSVAGTAFEDRYFNDSSAEIDLLHEFAGRSCYQAWNLPNPKTAENAGYMANIISQGHESVLEHGSVTFYVEGVSRALTHELIRHRHLSYSELSQRFVDMTTAEVVIPPAIGGDVGMEYQVRHAEDLAVIKYRSIVAELIQKGLTRKQAREAARCVLPGGMETKIVVTGNLRAWRDVLKKRHSVHADAEIQQFAKEVLKHLRTLAPHSVADIPDEPYE